MCFALNAETGAMVWKIKVNGEVLAPAAISERLIALRTVDGKLHGLAPADGHELWAQEQQVPRLSLRGTATRCSKATLRLCGFDNGKVVAVNINDGALQWEATVSPPHGRTELERLVDIDSAIDVSGSRRLCGRLPGPRRDAGARYRPGVVVARSVELSRTGVSTTTLCTSPPPMAKSSR